MYTIYQHQFIDAVQNGKKQVVKTLVDNEQLQTILNDFVDAQTKYTKAAVDANNDAMTAFGVLLFKKEFYSDAWLKPFKIVK